MFVSYRQTPMFKPMIIIDLNSGRSDRFACTKRNHLWNINQIIDNHMSILKGRTWLMARTKKMYIFVFTPCSIFRFGWCFNEIDRNVCGSETENIYKYALNENRTVRNKQTLQNDI